MTLAELTFLTIFWAGASTAILFLRQTFLPRSPITQTPNLLGLPSETVEFPATDGVALQGWKIFAEPNRPWIIMCHGVGSNRSDLLDVAATLHAARFNLLLFDFRGHGGSAGRVTSFGSLEQRDLEGALALLGQDPDGSPRPYGVYGISLGASVALLVAARDERLRALALDSPYADLEDSISRNMRLLYPLIPPIPFLWFVLVTYRLRFQVWPRNVSPERRIATLGHRPILLISGGSDPTLSPETASRMLGRSRGPKAHLLFQGAGHLGGLANDPTTYLSTLSGFFELHLREHP